MMRGHSLVWLGVLVALLALAVIAGIRVGAVDLAVTDIVAALSGHGDPTTRTIVWGLRLPRIVLAALCGTALALSGVTYQALLRNPLADPSLVRTDWRHPRPARARQDQRGTVRRCPSPAQTQSDSLDPRLHRH